MSTPTDNVDTELFRNIERLRQQLAEEEFVLIVEDNEGTGAGLGSAGCLLLVRQFSALHQHDFAADGIGEVGRAADACVDDLALCRAPLAVGERLNRVARFLG